YVSNEQCFLEDEALNRKGRPYRVGTVQDMLISNATDGVWDTLPNGDRLWRMAVTSKDATFVRPIFDTYVIPDGAELFVYTPEQDFVIGKFTNANADEGRFHTQIIPGETFVMEYYEPADAAFRGRLVVNQIGRGHRNAFGSGRYGEKGRLGTAEGRCHINVACPEGDDWRDQINGVVEIEITARDGIYSCSGSMINNTRNDNTQYLLSANHCQEGLSIRAWTFYFLYQASTCNGSDGPINKTATGATIIANKSAGTWSISGSDFLLLKVTGTINPAFNVYYNGWDRTNGNTGLVGSCIHHPGGDIKKISIPQRVSYMQRANTTMWEVLWITNPATNKGVTEEGSSGSPLFNSSKRIIGQLYAGLSFCDTLDGTDWYGKFYSSWTGGNTSASRLSDWLDPTGTNVSYLEGRYASDPVSITAPDAAQRMSLYPNPAKNTVNIEIDETGIAEYAIYTQTGVAVRQGRMLLGLSAYRLDVKGLAAGDYVLSIVVNGQRFSESLIIAK
ncbi:MAG: T9SS type A sorting domain-containing protein, partial [Bacteroidales bacterium]|nr:T9SS type A sorting domain-containing protein [Bacteroidales bacterium]